MMARYPVMVISVTLLAFVALSRMAFGAECSTLAQARAEHPQAYLAYSGRIEPGRRCWYAGERALAHRHSQVARVVQPMHAAGMAVDLVPPVAHLRSIVAYATVEQKVIGGAALTEEALMAYAKREYAPASVINRRWP